MSLGKIKEKRENPNYRQNRYAKRKVLQSLTDEWDTVSSLEQLINKIDRIRNADKGVPINPDKNADFKQRTLFDAPLPSKTEQRISGVAVDADESVNKFWQEIDRQHQQDRIVPKDLLHGGVGDNTIIVPSGATHVSDGSGLFLVDAFGDNIKLRKDKDKKTWRF